MIIVLLPNFKGSTILRMYSNQHCLFVFAIVSNHLYIQSNNNFGGVSNNFVIPHPPYFINF